MEGDLNLSQMLGGLRIANQADDSPPPSPRASSNAFSSNNDNQQSQIYIPDLQSLESTASLNIHGSPVSGAQAGGSTGSLPLHGSSYSQSTTPSQHQTCFGPPPPRATYPPPSAPSSRHSSQFLPNYTGSSSPFPPSTPGTSTSSQKYTDYTRLSREPSRSSLHGAAGSSGSRPTPRERSNTDRTYRQSQAAGPSPSHRENGAPEGPAPDAYDHGIPQSSDEWKEKGAAVRVRQETDANGNTVTRVVKKGVKDFNFGRTLGEGSYSTVLAATDRTTLKEYAIKVLDKRHIIKEEKVKYVNIEKNTLNRLGEHPGVIKLYYTFQDERSLYFVLDLATGGELLGTLKRLGTFDVECTRFYAAQILDTIEYMHSRGVIHRDLKPENVLLDDQMHIKITDFGTAKILELPKPSNNGEGPDVTDAFKDDVRANSFVGTAEYVSPELLTDKAACKASDLWAFGCIVFQLLTGRPPFKAGNEYMTFQKIVNLEYEFPKGFPPAAKDLVERLLVLDPTKRLTIEHIKNHEFFANMEIGRGLWKQKAPRLKPYQPPPEEPKIIKLGGDHPNGLRNGGAGPNGRPAIPPRVITELPPPSQLDIEWSPVLTRSNERILKLGNAVVHSGPAPHSPDGKHGVGAGDAPKKFSRFFGGNTTKKRQRLVMVTSAARIIIAAAGGDDKKPKTEISLQGLGVVVRKVGGGDGTTWAIDTVSSPPPPSSLPNLLSYLRKKQRDKCYTFEDPKTPASEWLEQIERAREIAMVNYPNGDDGFMNSTLSSPSSTITLEQAANGGHRSDAASERSNKRFSKRSSRHGLAAVF
ncbi:kinase-like domain-containing protein [Pyronema omphalodes]|nr:kinase-like domain-containing protein [Pyronema omphalodes]